VLWNRQLRMYSAKLLVFILLSNSYELPYLRSSGEWSQCESLRIPAFVRSSAGPRTARHAPKYQKTFGSLVCMVPATCSITPRLKCLVDRPRIERKAPSG
jgi:hypothetical protein